MTTRTLAALALAALPLSALAANCDGTATGLVPVSELGAGLYLGQFRGGLYPNGLNVPPPFFRDAQLAAAARIRPVNVVGNPDPGGAYVLLSMGMSNATQEFCSASGAEPCAAHTFMGKAAVHPAVNRDALVILNGARGGQTLTTWDDPAEMNYDRVRDTVLAPNGNTEAQVRAIWVKGGSGAPMISLPDPNADAYAMVAQVGDVVRAAKQRYPNLEIAFLASRTYGGYASTPLNPEPYAYESGFAMKWAIEAQIRQIQTGEIDPIAGDLDPMTAAPILAWGPYLWADGLTPRAGDGLTWECDDFQLDGTHPSTSGEEKVGDLLLDFYLTSPVARTWFRASGEDCPGDCNNNGAVAFNDLICMLFNFGNANPLADCDGSGLVDFNDLVCALFQFGPCG